MGVPEVVGWYWTMEPGVSPLFAMVYIDTSSGVPGVLNTAGRETCPYIAPPGSGEASETLEQVEPCARNSKAPNVLGQVPGLEKGVVPPGTLEPGAPGAGGISPRRAMKHPCLPGPGPRPSDKGTNVRRPKAVAPQRLAREPWPEWQLSWQETPERW